MIRRTPPAAPSARSLALAAALGLLPGLAVPAAAQRPEVAVHPQPGVPLAAVRIAFPLPQEPGALALGRTLQILAGPRAEARADAAGARLEMRVTPGEAVYSVAGPARALEAMIDVLRTATAPPDPSFDAAASALARAERDLLGELERPEGLIRFRLRQALAAGPEPEAPAAPAAITPARLRAFHAELVRPERMRVAAAGGIAAADVAVAIARWPAPPRAGRSDEGALTVLRPEPEAIFPWVGVAYPADGVSAAELAVAAALVDDALARLPLRAGSAEAWWEPDQYALVLLASPAERRPAAEVVQELRRAVAETAATLTAAEVEAARRQVLLRLLLAARTPQGLAELTGGLLDHTADPRALPRLLEALETLDADRLRDALVVLGSRSPAVAEVVP